MIYICFIVLVMLAASPQRGKAADSPAPENPPERRTLVVRVDRHTGKLIRRESAPKTTHRQITELVEKSARAHDVDPLLVHSMIQAESNFDAHAVSVKGAQGLMQLMPGTAKMLGVGDSFDPGENIEAGVKYLKYLKEVYGDDRLALAAYNAGPGAVDKYRQIPPYKETRQYVERVGRKYEEARKAAAEKTAPEKTAPALPPVIEEKHPKVEPFLDENGRLHLKTVQ